MVPLPLGKVVATPGALKLLLEVGEHPFDYLVRHASGDWGDLGGFDRRENERALRVGECIFSSCNTPAGSIWIITEADRSVTTIFLPEEY
jgi:hypothetical protein